LTLFQPESAPMFDQIVLVKIIEMQNEADRRRWRKDEDAFYRDLGHDFGGRFIDFWRHILPGATTGANKKKDRQLPTGPLLNACDGGTNHAAR
jgi:hypothetical protein